ncbi:rhythmically expressed gene 2 protein isoform X1 [Stomoxys calcitrans]|uniref:Rhythmically expressed gene 2 protein n=1 Tax=Stomoxys calcitrans TaxID=35570 RepID=A0A1I8PDU6_STOCA|nr:rhythmically expressed gene 2 protein isoform X1 [Stomoxys calcitrans]
MSSLGRLRLITFDVTNTLLQFRSSPGKQYGEIGALFGVRCNNNDLVTNFRSNWQKMNRWYPNFGRNSALMEWHQWWRQLISNTFAESGSPIPEDKIDSFTKHLLELYKTSSCWQHCNGSVDLLNYLRMQQQLGARENARGEYPFVMGVISNFDPRLPKLLVNLKIDHFLEFALNSYDCKVEKPNKEIFDMAMRASNLNDLKPEQCLHVGDGPTTDYIAAKSAGWNAALVHEKNANYLTAKYGEDKIDASFVFPSLYDFHRKLATNSITW